MTTKKNSNLSWWRKLLAEGELDVVSHKRLVSVVCLIMLIALSLMSAFGYSATTDYIYVFAMLTGGESMLTTVEKTAGNITRTKKTVRRGKNAEEIDEPMED